MSDIYSRRDMQTDDEDDQPLSQLAGISNPTSSGPQSQGQTMQPTGGGLSPQPQSASCAPPTASVSMPPRSQPGTSNPLSSLSSLPSAAAPNDRARLPPPQLASSFDDEDYGLQIAIAESKAEAAQKALEQPPQPFNAFCDGVCRDLKAPPEIDCLMKLASLLDSGMRETRDPQSERYSSHWSILPEVFQQITLVEVTNALKAFRVCGNLQGTFGTAPCHELNDYPTCGECKGPLMTKDVIEASPGLSFVFPNPRALQRSSTCARQLLLKIVGVFSLMAPGQILLDHFLSIEKHRRKSSEPPLSPVSILYPESHMSDAFFYLLCFNPRWFSDQAADSRGETLQAMVTRYRVLMKDTPDAHADVEQKETRMIASALLETIALHKPDKQGLNILSRVLAASRSVCNDRIWSHPARDGETPAFALLSKCFDARTEDTEADYLLQKLVHEYCPKLTLTDYFLWAEHNAGQSFPLIFLRVWPKMQRWLLHEYSRAPFRNHDQADNGVMHHLARDLASASFNRAPEDAIAEFRKAVEQARSYGNKGIACLALTARNNIGQTPLDVVMGSAVTDELKQALRKLLV